VIIVTVTGTARGGRHRTQSFLGPVSGSGAVRGFRVVPGFRVVMAHWWGRGRACGFGSGPAGDGRVVVGRMTERYLAGEASGGVNRFPESSPCVYHEYL